MPVEQNLICYRGQSFEQNIYFKQNGQPIDLSLMVPKSQIRPSKNNRMLTAEFTCIVDGPTGKLTLILDSAITASIPKGTYEWDLKMKDGNDKVKYWIKGKFIVDGRVTE